MVLCMGIHLVLHNKIKKIAATTLVTLLGCTYLNVTHLQAQNVAVTQQEIKNENKVIKKDNILLKRLELDFKIYEEKFKLINQKLKGYYQKEIDQVTYDKLVKQLVDDNKEKMTLMNSINTKIRKVNTIEEYETFVKSDSYNSAVNIFDKLNQIDLKIKNIVKDFNLNQKEKKQDSKEIYFWVIIIVIVWLILFSIIYTSQTFTRYRIRKFFKNVKWAKVRDVYDLGWKKFPDRYASYYTKILNETINKLLNKYYLVVNEDTFANHMKLIEVLLATRLLNDEIQLKLWKYYENAICTNLLPSDNPFEHLETLLTKFSLRNKIKQVHFDILNSDAKLIKDAKESNRLVYENITWYRKEYQRSIIQNKSYFIFEREFIRIVNSEVEYEIQYDKLKFTNKNRFEFNDGENDYFLITNSSQQMQIMAFIYRNHKIALWHSI